jgi:hypothetical protein
MTFDKKSKETAVASIKKYCMRNRQMSRYKRAVNIFNKDYKKAYIANEYISSEHERKKAAIDYAFEKLPKYAKQTRPILDKNKNTSKEA